VQTVLEVHVRQFASHAVQDYPEGKYLRAQSKHVDDEQLMQLLWQGIHVPLDK